MRSEAVAARLDAGDGCGARAEAEALQGETIAAVNDGRIPPRYHEELVGSVNTLVESIECVPPAPPDEEDEDDEEKDEDEEDEARGKGKGKKKGKRR